LASLGLLEDDHQKLETVSARPLAGEPAKLRAPTGATIATAFNATVVVFIIAVVVAGLGTEGMVSGARPSLARHGPRGRDQRQDARRAGVPYFVVWVSKRRGRYQ
jgi:hypothetical protein